MRILALLSVLLLIVPLASAIMTYNFDASLQSNLVVQGYQFARIQGANYNSQAVSILSWTMQANLGLSQVTCQLQPTFLTPNGPYEVNIPIQCQTRSAFTTFFPTGTKVSVQTSVPDTVPANSFTIDRIWIESTPQVQTPFPVVTKAITTEEATSGGSFLFFAGIGAIIILAVIAIVSARKQE